MIRSIVWFRRTRFSWDTHTARISCPEGVAVRAYGYPRRYGGRRVVAVEPSGTKARLKEGRAAGSELQTEVPAMKRG